MQQISIKMLNINDIVITVEMLSIIAELERFNGKWETMEKIAEKRLISLKKISTIESIGSSNRIEGNKLTDIEIETVLSKIDKTSFRSRDEQEVAGYAELMEIIFENYNQIQLTDNYIKQLHKILLQHTDKDQRHRGEYKKLSNAVAAYDAKGGEIGIIFETATPFEVPMKMEELIKWTNTNLEEKLLQPLIVIGIFIVNFLAIHPFQDGNGRLSRALTSLLLLKSGYRYIPFSSLESIVEKNKDEYYRSLRQTQKTLKTEKQNYENWLLFFLKMLREQKRILESKMPKEMEINLPKLAGDILSLFDMQSIITINDVVEKLCTNINTAKKSIKLLLDKDYIIKHGTTKGVWYTRNSKVL
ncbi:MAG: Fic family protein [Rickettsiales bacterium]|jgi:Fic family protein|nr:Fic family protein [Rickettsiales bacterium]